jgi:hypothetical protein
VKTKIDSEVYAGDLYSIVRVFIRSKAINSVNEAEIGEIGLYNSTTLVVLKHNPETQQPEKVMEETTQKLVGVEHDWSYSLKPYFFYKDVMYFATFENNFDIGNEKIIISIKKFAFEKPDEVSIHS